MNKVIAGLCFTFTSFACLGGAFVNLGFDSPDVPVPSEPFEGGLAIWYVPGWSEDVHFSSVGFNYSQPFVKRSSLLNHDFRDSHFDADTKVPVVGNYSLGVWPRSQRVTPGVFEPYILRQIGDIPSDAKSLQFLYHGNDLIVYVGGEIREFYALPDVSTGDPEIPLFHYFAVDVGSYAGQTAELKFEFRSQGYDDFRDLPRLPGEQNAMSHVLDDLRFSPLPAIPEPSTWALGIVGAVSLSWWYRRTSRRGGLRDHLRNIHPVSLIRKILAVVTVFEWGMQPIAGEFINLDFDSPDLSNLTYIPDSDLAYGIPGEVIPGWTITQDGVLIDRVWVYNGGLGAPVTLAQNSPDNYILGYVGYSIPLGINKATSLWQVGTIPEGAFNLEFEWTSGGSPTGKFGPVHINGQVVDAYSNPQTPFYYSADVSAWAGQEVMLSMEFGKGTSQYVDNLRFTVPEPSTWILALSGLGGLTWFCRRT